MVLDREREEDRRRRSCLCSLPASAVCLHHPLQNSSHDLREGGKKERKSGSGRPIFFSHSSQRQRVVVLSSVRRGARPDGEAGPRRETQPLRSGSAAEATSCKRLVISGRNAANEPEIKPPRAEHCSLSSRHGGTLQKQSCCKPPQQEGAQGGTAPAWCPPPVVSV